jgi:predicted nucleotidyltransferase
MDSHSVLLILREHEPELKAAGIAHLRLFGSTARGEASLHSDIDLLADFETPASLTLVTIGRLQSRLADLLGAEVDLSSPDWMRPPVRTQALEEAILAF